MAPDTEGTSSIDFCLPSLGADMDVGTVVTWRVSEGDRVAKGDVLVDVDTEKSEIEVEVWQDAQVAELLVPPGQEVAVGTPLARLLVSEDAAATSPPRPAPTVEPSAATPEPKRRVSTTPPPATHRSAGSRAPNPTPRTVFWPTDVAVEATEEGPPASAQPPDREQSRAERRQAAVAALMERSNTEIPHFHLATEIDVGALVDWLAQENENKTPHERILPAAALLRATAIAAQRHSGINGHWVDGSFDPADIVQLGVATHIRGGGLMTPVIPDAAALALPDLMSALREVVGRARSGSLRSSDLVEPTLTVTNLGDAGVDSVFGIIRPPQVALVGFGQVRDRPIVVDHEVHVRPVVTASLSVDHRANNGQTGAAFLQTLTDLITTPQEL